MRGSYLHTFQMVFLITVICLISETKTVLVNLAVTLILWLRFSCLFVRRALPFGLWHSRF